MTNKTVIRKPNVAGEFTTVHHFILLDKRLSAMAFRVMTCILMDSNSFSLSRTLLSNRLGVDKKTIKTALDNLEECGYLKRTPFKNKSGFYYTISDYGNLHTNEQTTIQTNESVEEIVPLDSENTPTTEGSTIREITEKEASFLLDFLIKNDMDKHFEKILLELNTELSNGTIKTVDEKAILKKISQESKTRKNVKGSLGQIRQLYKLTELFDAILPIVQEKSGGYMITQKSKEDIVLRTMRKFADSDETLNEKKIVNYILTIKGEYTNTGSLDQRYQN